METLTRQAIIDLILKLEAYRLNNLPNTYLNDKLTELQNSPIVTEEIAKKYYNY